MAMNSKDIKLRYTMSSLESTHPSTQMHHSSNAYCVFCFYYSFTFPSLSVQPVVEDAVHDNSSKDSKPPGLPMLNSHGPVPQHMLQI